MREPLTPHEFLDAVRTAHLLPADRLDGFAVALRGQPALTARRVADRAVTAGLLTRFQADEVLGGRATSLIIGSYQLQDRLGAGASGEVFLAHHTTTGERRALKVLNDRGASNRARARLAREGSLTSLTHPNLVKVFEFDPGDTDHPPFLAMEYLDGVSLQAAVALGGTLTAEQAAECGRQAADALQHAWAAGLVHQDIKPANILLTRGGRVKVLDFGQARTPADGPSRGGTAEYAAPELEDDTPADTRADVFALGGTLYFLLAGHPPRGLDPRRTWTDPTPIHRLRPDVPEELSKVIGRMIARHPEHRFATPGDAARALAPWPDPRIGDELFTRLARASGERRLLVDLSPVLLPSPVVEDDPTTPDLASRLKSTARFAIDTSSGVARALARPAKANGWWWPTAAVVAAAATAAGVWWALTR